MKPMICECCGGQINLARNICEYCGTQYKTYDYENVIRVETFSNPVKVYKSQIEIPREAIISAGEELASKQAIRMLSRNLADAIAENMELETQYNIMDNTQRISARVRIVEPKYMF